MNMENPRATVLMPVYNGEKYLSEAIESILNQTFNDFEFIIIDDGSIDSSEKIIRSYNDKRIKLYKNEINSGVVFSLNRGLELAKGEYIVRMDCDDISLPQRLEKQLDYMDSNKEIGICGSGVKIIGYANETIAYNPTDADILKCLSIFGIPIAHPTVIMRRTLLDQYNLRYDSAYPFAEDYELWARCVNLFSIANTKEVLLLYRVHGRQIGSKYSIKQVETANIIRSEQLKKFGVTYDAKEIEMHYKISLWSSFDNKAHIREAEQWLLKLKNTNDINEYFPKDVFLKVLGNRWYSVCRASTRLGLWIWMKYNFSPLNKRIKIRFSDKLVFFIKSIIKW